MIEARELRVRYPGSDTDALHGVSLIAEPGVLTAIVGPNGSGKSTLVRALLGRVPLAAGDLRVAGTRVAGGAARDLARLLAVVVQREEPAFPLLVNDYVALGRHPWRDAWQGADAADGAWVLAAMEQADVIALRDRRTDTLSGGEWQRVRVARALAQDTPVVVFDEPTTFLDVAHEMACFELLDALAARGRTVLVVSHQLNLVARFARRVGLLSSGTLAAFGDPSDVMRGEVLERVYQWPLVVSRDPAVGSPMLVPLRRHR
ncbi:MAG: ABC transporter ATP-binding protein [Gemmatimonadaceae bacterium]|nr:ABC transporter ATP-binding protein [Gemmatimonadaceae bacterium]